MTDDNSQSSDSSTEGLEEETLDAGLTDESEGKEGDNDSSKSKGRTAKDRIDDLSFQLEEEKKRVRELEAKVTEKVPMPTVNDPESSPEAKKIIQQLEGLGFTRKQVIEESVKQIESRMELNAEHRRLSDEYDGSDGRPKYDKARIEGFMRDRAIFDPEVAYKVLNEAELLDWNLKKAKTGSDKQPFVAKPGGSSTTRVADSQITREKVQEVANNPTPANREWYERNRTKILQLMSEGKL